MFLWEYSVYLEISKFVMFKIWNNKDIVGFGFIFIIVGCIFVSMIFWEIGNLCEIWYLDFGLKL